MYVNLDILLEIVSIEVQDQVMNIVKPITHNDERQLICQLGFLNKTKKGNRKKNWFNVVKKIQRLRQKKKNEGITLRKFFTFSAS